MNALGYLLKSLGLPSGLGFSGFKLKAGWTEGLNCLGSNPLSRFSRVQTFTEYTGPAISKNNGMEIYIGTILVKTKTFNITSMTGTGTKDIKFIGSWDTPLELGDMPMISYDGTGDFVNDKLDPLLSFNSKLTNCLSPTYGTGSIYSSTQSLLADWTTMKQATGVNALLIKNGTQAVNIGWGTTRSEAEATQKTIPIGDTQIIDITGNYISWFGSSGTFDIEQSVIDGLNTFVYGSIYDSTQTIDTNWQTMSTATGVTALLFKDITEDINIGYGNIVSESEVQKHKITKGNTIIIPINTNYISWSGSISGTFNIQQSRN